MAVMYFRLRKARPQWHARQVSCSLHFHKKRKHKQPVGTMDQDTNNSFRSYQYIWFTVSREHLVTNTIITECDLDKLLGFPME